MNKKQVLEALERLEAKPLKSLGQNFLIDSRIVESICNYSKIDYNLNVLEIGPGLGSLTTYIEENKNIKPTLIELDRAFSRMWEERGYKVFNQDALKYPWSDLNEPSLILSNLPYQISSRFIIEIFKQDPPVKQMVLMFQKEVAERILADTEDKKTYGLISILSQLNWKIDKVCSVPAASFFPRPDVESCVLYFEKKDFHLDSRSDFLSHLKKLFSTRRKKIKGRIENIENVDIDVLNKRPDALRAEEHLELFLKVQK